MSIVAAIRDYIDVINSNCDVLPPDAGFSSLLLPTFKYILESLKYAAFYVATFQWLRDLVYLPLVVPDLTLSILKETCYPFESPTLNFFTFLEAPAYRDNSFVVGFLNSFFACLPISAGHILSGRRLLVEGIPAGLAAGSGMILGQWGFVVCVVMGVRHLLVPWLALEPFNYLLGLGLLVNIVYRITHERRIRVVGWGDRRKLLQYFLTSLLLSWCEQTTLFQYLGNITVDTGTTLLDNFSTSSRLGSNPDVSYVLGLLIGSCLFTLLFVFITLYVRRLWLKWRATISSRLTLQLNTIFLVTLIAFSFASVPYYGVDYLLTNKIGFMSQDMALDKTIFAPATMDDTTGKMGIISDNKSFDTDVSTFDRGWYLQQQKPVSQSFEDLNYQGEYTWTKRYGKYTRHLVKRKAPLVWSNLFKRIGENDNLRLSNPKDRDRQQKKLDSVQNLTTGLVQEPSHTDAEGALENDAIKTLILEATDHMDADDIGDDDDALERVERLDNDDEIENEFLSLFDTGLSPFFINRVPEASTFETRLKKRIAENPLYPLLLHIDIDSFLNRQPAIHSLSAAEEEALFQKRYLLGKYYDSLRQYNQLQNWDYGSKSFANRVYNQQFKGTLRVVRRLFSITPKDEAPSLLTKGIEGRVLKFDQPLFYQPIGSRQTADTKIFHLHEELTPYTQNTQNISPFVEAVQSKPLYAGWDEELRKLVLTNRSLPRSDAGYNAIIPQLEGPLRFSTKSNTRPQDVIHFTSWPVPIVKRGDKLKVPVKVPHQLSFHSVLEPQNRKIAEPLTVSLRSKTSGRWHLGRQI